MAARHGGGGTPAGRYSILALRSLLQTTVECHTYTVPLDWADAAGKTLDLDAIRYSAPDPAGTVRAVRLDGAGVDVCNCVGDGPSCPTGNHWEWVLCECGGCCVGAWMWVCGTGFSVHFWTCVVLVGVVVVGMGGWVCVSLYT